MCSTTRFVRSVKNLAENAVDVAEILVPGGPRRCADTHDRNIAFANGVLMVGRRGGRRRGNCGVQGILELRFTDW